jgi:hypothetical protein
VQRTDDREDFVFDLDFSDCPERITPPPAARVRRRRVPLLERLLERALGRLAVFLTN